MRVAVLWLLSHGHVGSRKSQYSLCFVLFMLVMLCVVIAKHLSQSYYGFNNARNALLHFEKASY